MVTRKINEYLDTGDNESDRISEYESENDNIRKGRRVPKRRNDEVDQSEDDEVSNSESVCQKKRMKTVEETPIYSSKQDSRGELPGVSKPLLKKNLVATEAAIKRSGVVYLSRIPPYMKPSKLRSLLEPYGAINRIFLTPEDASSYTRRIRAGGNKKRSFIDGWVEFTRKSEAKAACELLNARNIGGRKGTYYHDDVWNLLYLKGFKWNNLTEQISAENAERVSRMRAEISKTTKENKEYIQNVERAKMLQGIQSKKAAKESESKTEGTITHSTKGNERLRDFKQKPVVTKSLSEIQSEQVNRVLRKIF